MSGYSYLGILDLAIRRGNKPFCRSSNPNNVCNPRVLSDGGVVVSVGRHLTLDDYFACDWELYKPATTLKFADLKIGDRFKTKFGDTEYTKTEVKTTNAMYCSKLNAPYKYCDKLVSFAEDEEVEKV